MEYINGAYVSSGNQNINNEDNSDVFGIYSNGAEIYNLYSVFAHPDDRQEVNIENKNSIKITITKGSEKKEYTIKLNRLVENLAEEPKEEKKTITTGKTIRKEEKINIFSILVPIIGIILLILNTILVIKRIKKK